MGRATFWATFSQTHLVTLVQLVCINSCPRDMLGALFLQIRVTVSTLV
jgi:hypothetical protein